jgi:hypothetical protein
MNASEDTSLDNTHYTNTREVKEKRKKVFKGYVNCMWYNFTHLPK